ncbi:MAG TPA: hypothetical protein VMY76_00630 [Gemmatimonadales bacterium]|nr:hypothetical protein [Gemmatimonadales bacterium]
MVDRYWPTLTGKELADAVLDRFEEFEEAFRDRDLLNMRLATLAYYGEDEDGNTTATIARTGSKDQVRILKDNEFRTVIGNMLTIATMEPGGFLPVPVNTDSDATATSLQLRGVLDYYFDEGKFDRVASLATEIAKVLGFAHVDVPWNDRAGDVVDETPSQVDEAGAVVAVQQIHSGDVEAHAMLPSEVAFDYDARDESPWRIIRRWRNKWDLAAMVEDGTLRATLDEGEDVPRLADRIRAMTHDRTRDEIGDALRGGSEAFRRRPTNDEIPVYELRHRPTPACPAGRWALVLEGGALLAEGPSRYGDDLAVYRIADAERFGTPRAYTSAHGMLGLQLAVDTLTSIPYSNQAALGLNIVVTPEKSELKATALMEGLVHIEHSGGEEMAPKVLTMTNTPKEVFPFRRELKADMASKLGMDNLSMGREERDLSGAAMALLDSRTQRAVSVTAKAFTQLRQDIANAVLRRFKQFGEHSRKLPLLVGKFKRPMLADFTGKTFDGIDRVRVENISALMRSPAGRLELAKLLVDAQKAQVEPELIMSVIETGKFESLTEAPMAIRTYIREENERLLAGEVLEAPAQINPLTGQPGPGGTATAVFTDNPLDHIREHRVVLLSLAARRDPRIVANTRAHMEAHMRDLMAWVQGDPIMLALHGPPPPLAPVGAGTQPGQPGTPGSTPPPQPGEQTGTAPPVVPGGPTMPTNPATGEQYTPTGDVANG